MPIKAILKQNKWRLTFTIFLILTEAFIALLFPLFIGKAIEGFMLKEINGLISLGVIGFLLVLLGGLRRLIDSRFYAKIYTRMSSATIKKLANNQHSVKAARLNMLSEMVDFAENQLPEIIQHTVGLIGVIIIIAFLNLNIFFIALLAGILVIGIYWMSGSRTIAHNYSFNNELENQVNVINSNKQSNLKHHLLKLMKFNIKLSDIETINYSISWLIMMGLLLLAIVFSTSEENIKYGALFAIIMYVYQYIESMVSLPLYYQQWLRLKEITIRIQKIK